MGTCAKSAVTAVVVLMVCTGAMALGFKDLTIDVNSTPGDWWIQGPSGAVEGKGPVRPTHLAHLFVFNSGKGLPDITTVLGTQSGKTLSQEQKDLVTTGQGIVWPHRSGRTDGELWFTPSGWNRDLSGATIPNYFEVFLYAVNKDELDKLVHAYVEALDAEANRFAGEARRLLAELNSDREGLRGRLAEVEAEMRDIVQKRGGALSPEDIGRVISSTQEVKNSLQIEIAGLNARIEAITKFVSAKDTSPESKTRLQDMLIDHNIELAGALAKLKTADAARELASEKYGDSIRLGDLRREMESVRSRVEETNGWMRKAEMDWRKADAEVVEPRIYQNKVTIHPVEQQK